jgi:transcriptional regulator with XRE-family HTH domain
VIGAAQTVGVNLRRLRLARGLSLVELGRLSGLAKGTLTQLEAGRANPTIETLQALARALGARLDELVAEPPAPSIEVVRADEGPPVPGTRLRGRMVHRAHLGTMVVECFALRLTAGMVQNAGSHAPGVVEHLYVLSGTVEIGPVGETAVLHEHDFARFPADRPHLIAAPEGDAHALSWLFFPAVPAPAAALPTVIEASEMRGSMLPRAPLVLPDTGELPVAAVAPSPLAPSRVLPQPPVRGRRPPSRTVPGPMPGRPKPPGPGR